MGGFGPPFRLQTERRMNFFRHSLPFLLRSIAFMTIVLATCTASAQAIMPALTQATSVDAALNAVGANKAQPHSRLALQFEEIALPGPLKIVARSEIPGTTGMVLMVGAPTGWYGSGAPGETPLRAAQPVANKPGAPAQPAVVLAWQVPPGKKPVLRATYPQLQQRQAFTLLIFAQGRWFMTVREAKLACESAAACRRGQGMGR
jgi:hypothetical protein